MVFLILIVNVIGMAVLILLAIGGTKIIRPWLERRN